MNDNAFFSKFLLLLFLLSAALFSCNEIIQGAIEDALDDGKPKIVSTWEDDKVNAQIVFFDDETVIYGSNTFTYRGNPNTKSGTLTIYDGERVFDKWESWQDHATGSEHEFTRVVQ